jgi:V8-like Glu-specific endopeptidase
VFDYSLKGSGDRSYTQVSADRVYECKEVVARQFNYFTDLDYAIIRLDRKVRDRAPITVDLSSGLDVGMPVFTMGHPSGLPMKVTDSSTIIANNSPTFFETELDTFKGNSGSPVFDGATLHVIGVISEGHADYTSDGKCKKPIICTPDRPCNKVKVSRALNFKSDLEKLLQQN